MSESSLGKDRGRKRRLYASCQIPEYWIVNLVERCVEVYREPDGQSHARMDSYEYGQSIRLLAFPDVSIAVAEIMK